MSELHETVRALELRIAELEAQRSPRNRRRLRRPMISRRVALLGLALALLLPGVVLASHRFNDVPDGNPFHTEISAITGAGITAGFADGGYHPSEAVTRQAMAAFLHRIGGRAALAVGDPPMTAAVTSQAGSDGSGGVVPVRQLTITVPGASNSFSPQQLVHLQGRVIFATSMSTSSKGCPCQFNAVIHDMTTNAYSIVQVQTFESSTTNGFYYSFDVEGLFAASPGARTYQLELVLGTRNSSANTASFTLTSLSSLSAMTFPFGPTGGNTP
ncbi:MAG: S-layer homology domain-containing protein [Candidatus Limnocylindrales bacterium]